MNTTDIGNVSDIVNQLLNITTPNNQSQLPMDISVAVEVLETVIRRCFYINIKYILLVNCA